MLGSSDKITDANCLKHGKRFRSDFHFILNWLKNFLSGNHVSKFSSIVPCVCRPRMQLDSSENVPESTTEDLLEEFARKQLAISEYFQKHNALDQGENVTHFVKKFKPTESLSLNHIHAMMEFMDILIDMLHGRLERLKAPNEEKGSISKIIKLQIYPCHIGKLLGRKGQHVKRISKRNNGHILLFTNHKRVVYHGRVSVKIKSDKPCNIAAIEEDLNKHVEKIRQTEREIIAKRIQRRKVNLSYHIYADTPRDKIYEETKSRGRLAFSRKSGSKALKRTSHCLQESRCINCHLPFQSRDHPDYKLCHHHPGYICVQKGETNDEEYWTCCFEKPQTSSNGVFQNGCTTSNQHNFRPTKFSPCSKGKSKQMQKQQREKQQWFRHAVDMVERYNGMVI